MKPELPEDTRNFLGLGNGTPYTSLVRPPSFKTGGSELDEKSASERKARFQASAEMLFGTDVAKLDDTGAAALYQSVTEGMFGLADTDGTVAFGKRASKDMRHNIDLLRRFVKGEYNLIEDPEYTKWREMDEEGKFRYALENETATNKARSFLKGERGANIAELAGAGMQGAQFGNFMLNASAPNREDTIRRTNYDSLTDEEKAEYRADVIGDYEKKLSRNQTLATYLQFAEGLSDKAAYCLAKSFGDGTPDINIEMLDKEERDRVYSAFSLMRGDRKRGRILGMSADFTDDTAANRAQIALYGLQQSLVGLVTDAAEFGRDAAMWAYAKASMDEAERKAFFEAWDANVRAEQAMEQALPEAEGWLGAGVQGLAENVHWFIPYGAIGKGGKMAAAAGKTVARAGLMKEAVTGMRTASELKAAAAKTRWLSDVQGAVKAGKGAKKVSQFQSAVAMKRELAAIENYTKALAQIADVEKTAKAGRIGGRALWTIGEASAFSAFASEYVAAADAAGVSREESMISAFAIGLVNAKIERLYVAGLESSLSPAQIKALTFKALYNAVKSEGSAGFRKWFVNRVQRGVVEGAKVTATEGLVEEPLQQLAVEHGIAFDNLCQELRADGKTDFADKAAALWRSFAGQLPEDYGVFVDTVCDTLPTSLAFGATTVGNMTRRQHLHNAWTRHQNRRAGSTHTMFGATSPEELRTAIDYDAGLVDLIQQGINTQLAVEKHWKGDKSDEAKNPHRFAEALTAARRAYRDPQTRDIVQEVAQAAGVDVKTAEVITQYLQTEAEAIAFSPQARAFSSLRMSLADIDETTIKTVLPGYIEGSYAADEENGIYSGRVKLGDGTERTIAYRIGDVSEMLREQVEENSKIDSSYGVSFDERQEELGTGITWASLSDAQRYQYALTLSNAFATRTHGVFELTDAKGEKVRVNADDVIYLANGRFGDIGYGPAATMGTARHETFHSLWRFARATMDEADVQSLAKALGVDVTANGWENKLDERMAHQLEMYASGHYVSHAVSSRFDRMLDGWAGNVIKFFGSFGPADEVRDPKTGKSFALKDFYDKVLRGELGSGKLGVEIRNIPAAPAVQPGATDVKAGTMPVEVTDEERAAEEAETRKAATETEKPVLETEQPVSGTEKPVSGTSEGEIVYTAENPADASVSNARYYKIGLPNSDVKLVGRLEVRDAHAGLTTSTDEDYHDRGNQNRDDKSEESRALVMKIAGHPDPLQIGTVQPIANNGIVWILNNSNVIIGNHRVNGVRAGYEKGTAGDLEKFVREDAAKRGIEIGENVKKPLMVFVLERIESPEGQKAADVHEVVRLANESQNRGFNIREQAGNDAKILVDNHLLPRMAFRADGRIDETKCADAIGKFRQESGAQGLVGEDGMLTEEGQTRLQNAAIAALLAGTGNNALLGRIMDNAGRLDMASQLRALMKVTPELMALAKTKPQFDIRDALAEALTLYTEWREKDEEKRSEKGKNRHDWRELDKEGKRKRGLSWEAFMSQGDMFRTPSEEAKILGDLFARTEQLRSFDREDVESAAGKKRVVDLITDYLTDYIENARNVNTETEDMFGGTPASRAEVLAAQRAKGESGARFSIVTPAEDAAYMEAVERGDMETARKLLKVAWERNGYSQSRDHLDAHAAPSAPVEAEDFKNVEALMEAREEGWDLNLWAVAKGISGQPNDFFSEQGPRLYGYDDKAGIETQKEIAKAISMIQAGINTRIYVYRAVPNAVKSDFLQSGGEWVSPSKTYVENHGKFRFGEGEYRIIERLVPAEHLWWDGNDAREWGYDDGRQYVYANTENGSKLATVTYNSDGNVIPLSQRFNPQNNDIRFSIKLNALPLDEAKERISAQKNIPFRNFFTDLEVTLSSSAEGKLVSKKAAMKSVENGFTFEQHNAMAASVGELFERGFEAVRRGDRKGDANIKTIRRYVCPVAFDEKKAFAWITVKESKQHGAKIYSVESIELEAFSRKVEEELLLAPHALNAPTAHIVSQNGDEAQTRFSIGGVYTGSAADYEKPSLHYVGSGEGSQVYGWGLYGSTVRGVAESYAKKGTYSQDPIHPTLDGKTEDEWAEKSPERLALQWLFRYGDLETVKSEVIDSWENPTPDVQAAFDLLLNESNRFATDEKKQHLYEQTFFTDRAPGDESHLLKWYEPVSEEQAEWIFVSMIPGNKNAFNSVIARYVTDWRTRLEKAEADPDSRANLELNRDRWITGQQLYGMISEELGSPQAASEFLARAGIDGVKYPVDSYAKTVKDGDKVGWNYVSFRDDNIRVDHKWVDGEQRFSIRTRLYNPETAVTVVDGSNEPDFLNLTTAEIRNYLRDKYVDREVEIDSDGTLVLFTGKGLNSTLKKRGKHKRVLHVLDELVKNSHYTRFEPNDGQEKHSHLIGQFVYTAAIRLSDGVYGVELKLDIPKSDPEGTHFKGQTVKTKIADAVLSVRRADGVERTSTDEASAAETVRLGDIVSTPQIVSNSLFENNGPSAELLEAMGEKALKSQYGVGSAARNGEGFVDLERGDTFDGIEDYLKLRVKEEVENTILGISATIGSKRNANELAQHTASGEDNEVHKFAAKNALELFRKAGIGIIHHDKKGTKNDYIRAFAPFYFKDEVYLATITLCRVENVDKFYAIESILTKKDAVSGVSRGKTAPFQNAASQESGDSPRSSRRTAQEAQSPVSLEEKISYYVGDVNATDPKFLNSDEEFSLQKLAKRIRADISEFSTPMFSVAPGADARASGLFPALQSMSDDELVTAAAAVKMALGKSEKVSDKAVKISSLQKVMRRLHPEWGTAEVGRESLRVMSDARKFAKKIREDLDRGVSDSLVLEHLPKTMREQFGREMIEEARKGQRLGRFGQKVADTLEERQARVVENAVRVQSGIDVSIMENTYGINLSETLMHLAENPLTEKPPAGASAAENGEALEDEESAAAEESSAVDVGEAVKKAVADVVAASGVATDANERNRADRRAAAGRDKEREAELGGEDEAGAEGGAGDDFGGDIVAVATRKAGLDLENPRHLAEFVAELTRRYWIKEHELALDAEVWRDLVALQFLRKTAQGVYAKLCKDLTYSRSRETAMQHIARLDNVPTVQGLLSEMEFVGALINAQRIRDTQKAMCEKLDLFLRQKFGAQGRFKPDKEEGKRNVSAEAELRARYMRHAMWLTPDAAAEEARTLQETLDALSVDFKDAGRDVDQSREFIETIRKLNVLREFGALRYKSVGEIEAAAKWWEDFERGESDDIMREMSDRDIRTKKAAHLLAVAFADPARKVMRGEGKLEKLNEYITGHMGFVALLNDCMRHASDADRAAVKDIVGYIAREIQKAGDGTASEKRRNNDAFHAAVEAIYGRKFNSVMTDMMAVDERFLEFMGETGGVKVPPTKARAMQLLVSLLQEGRKVEVEDEENPGKTKIVWEGGYHDNIVLHKREGQAEKIMKLLTPADLNMVKWLGMWYEQNRQDLSAVCHKLFGIGVYAELPNYFPVKMLLEKQGLEKGEAVGWTIFPKALTPRVKNERDFDTSADIFQMWASRMEEGVQWKHHAQLGLEMRGIFGRSELQAAVIAHHGAQANALMQGFITDILAGQGTVDRSMAGTQYFSDKVRGWTALCALGGNVGVMLKQTTSIPAFGFEIGLVNTARHFVSAFTPEGIQAMAAIWNSEQRKTRWDVGNSEAVANALRKEDAGWLKRAFQAAMITNKLGDAVPGLVIGQGIYRDCLERGMSAADAMAETWMIIERTQQSSRMENLASMQRRSRLGRTMFQFLSTQRQYLDYEMRAIREVIAQPSSVNRWKKLGTTILLNHFILSSAYYWMGQLYKAMLGQEPPEDELTDWVITCLLGPYGSLFMVGFCCNYTLQRALKGYSYGGGSSMLPMESWLTNQINDAGRLVEAIFSNEGDSWENMLDAAGKWMSDFNSTFRDLRKIYRFRIQEEPQKRK